MNPQDVKAILDAISSRNIEDIQTLLLLFGISVLVTYFAVRVAKSAEIAEINRNFGEVLSQQRSLAEATGEIQSVLDKDHSRYQIQLSAYQNRSLDAIEDLYGRICTLRDNAVKASHWRESRQEFLDSSRDFQLQYELKKIWLPEDLSVLFLDFASDLDLRLRRFTRAQDALDAVSTQSSAAINRAADTQDEFYDFIQQQLNPLVDALAVAVNRIVAPPRSAT